MRSTQKKWGDSGFLVSVETYPRQGAQLKQMLMEKYPEALFVEERDTMARSIEQFTPHNSGDFLFLTFKQLNEDLKQFLLQLCEDGVIRRYCP